MADTAGTSAPEAAAVPTPDGQQTKARDGYASTAASLVALQGGSRLLTFVMNQVILRMTTPEVFGTVTIQLEFLLNTILFLSRESFRGALVRSHLPLERVLEISSYVPRIGVAVTLLACTLYAKTASSAVAAQPLFVTSVALYGLAAVLELMSEPSFIANQVTGQTRLRVRIEGLAVIGRAVVTLLFIYRSSPPLLAFALGQLVYACILLVLFKSTGIRNVPERASPTGDVKETKALLWALAGQSVVKQFLTEGDKLIVSRVVSIREQGAYAVALNYGSLVVRIALQPAEEASRLYFATSKSNVRKSVEELLRLILYLDLLLGLPFWSVLPVYCPLALRIILPNWPKSAALSLQAYCYYVPFLAINGQLEAYFASFASTGEIQRQSRAMIGLTVLNGIFVWLFNALGAPGLVYACIASMTLRILWTGHRLRRDHPDTIRLEIFPHLATYVVWFVGSYVAYWLQQQALAVRLQLGSAVLLGGLCVASTIALEHRRLMPLLHNYTKRRSHAHVDH